MKVKVFEKNENGKIEFTRKELEALLNEVYNDGHADGYREGRDSKTYTWTSPTYLYSTNVTTTTPYKTDFYCSSVTCDASDSITTSNISNSDSYLSVSYGM